MKIAMLILIILITYDSVPFLYKYVKIRKQKYKTKALIISIKHSNLGRSGLIPVVSYKVKGDNYQDITPIYSTFTSYLGDKIQIGSELDVFYNSKKPNECIIPRDLVVILQVVFLLSFYILFILIQFNKIR